jgi:hypothetical protein
VSGKTPNHHSVVCKCDPWMIMENISTLDIKHLVLLTACPAELKEHDLYVIRDYAVVFYVGQSYSAFTRVWEHIMDGYKARSIVGRFILCNWPASMNFQIDFFKSKSDLFLPVDHELEKAELQLINRYRPCFNEVGNYSPTPLPKQYKPVTEFMRYSHTLRKLQFQAEMAIEAEAKRTWKRI